MQGKDKGKVGKVLRVNPRSEKEIVECANIIKRHTRQKAQTSLGDNQGTYTYLKC